MSLFMVNIKNLFTRNYRSTKWIIYSFNCIKYHLSDLSMIVGVVNDSDDLFVVGDVSSGCGGTSEHGRGSLNVVVV